MRRQIQVVGHLLAIITTILLPKVLKADDSDAEIIIQVATGVGADERQAEIEALRASVQQAAGSIISAETLVKNDELIRDKVLVYSSGIVKRHEIVGSPKKIDGGLVRVTIRAQVEKRELLKRLEAASIHSVNIDGGNVLAQWEAKLKNEHDGAKILASIIENLPARVLKAEVVGEPRRIAITGDGVKLGIQVRFSIDNDKWQTWLTTAKPYLEKLSKKRDSIPWRPKADFCYVNFDNIREFTGKAWAGEWSNSTNPYDFRHLSAPTERRQAMFGDDKWGTVAMTHHEIETSFQGTWSGGLLEPKDYDLPMMIVIDRFPSGTAYKFVFEKEVFDGLREANFAVPTVSISLVDAADKEIVSQKSQAVFKASPKNIFTASPLWYVRANAHERERGSFEMAPFLGGSRDNADQLRDREGYSQAKLIAVGALAAPNENCLISSFSNEFVFELSKDEMSHVKHVVASINVQSD